MVEKTVFNLNITFF